MSIHSIRAGLTPKALASIHSQCTNGHLMCAGCLAHLLADARLKDEEATCPNCRCDIGKNLCTRNLAVEKAISEMPATCQYCTMLLPRNTLENHEKELCQERYVSIFVFTLYDNFCFLLEVGNTCWVSRYLV